MGMQADAWIVKGWRHPENLYWNGHTGKWQEEMVIFLNTPGCHEEIDTSVVKEYTVIRYKFDKFANYYGGEQPDRQDWE